MLLLLLIPTILFLSGIPPVAIKRLNREALADEAFQNVELSDLNDDDKECPICYEAFDDGTRRPIRLLHGHCFCQQPRT